MFCPWEPAQYVVYSSNIPTLFYYSHISTMLVGLIVGIFIYRQNKNSLDGKLLLLMTVFFFIWSFFDFVIWATNDPKIILFFWSMQIAVETLIYGTALYALYAFIYRKDLRFGSKLLLILPFIPLFIFLGTKYTLVGVNIDDCNAIEGFFAQYYSYIIEGAFIFSMLVVLLRAIRRVELLARRKEIIYFGIGIITFLIAFSWGNIIGSFTDNWTLAQAGLIGMPILFGFLAYITTKFKTFNTKVFGAQVLVFVFGFLVLSLGFIRTIENVRIVLIFTLLFLIILGYQLVRGVKREVEQREKLEVLTVQLGEANEKLKGLDKLKTEFLSLASHQLRSPLTAIKGYASMVLEGDYGKINAKAKEAIDRIFQSSQNLTVVVEDLLNVSKIEQGGMKYEMAVFPLSEIAKQMATDLSITAEKRGLKLTYSGDDEKECMVNGDKEKLRQVVLNFIDNSIKYTKTGSIDVSVHKKGDKVVFAVKDTGMGMTPEIKATLFQKFARGDGARMNTTGSGLGLYLAKEIVEAHKGRVWVESDGAGKGSTFAMELDAVK